MLEIIALYIHPLEPEDRYIPLSALLPCILTPPSSTPKYDESCIYIPLFVKLLILTLSNKTLEFLVPYTPFKPPSRVRFSRIKMNHYLPELNYHC